MTLDKIIQDLQTIRELRTGSEEIKIMIDTISDGFHRYDSCVNLELRMYSDEIVILGTKQTT